MSKKYAKTLTITQDQLDLRASAVTAANRRIAGQLHTWQTGPRAAQARRDCDQRLGGRGATARRIAVQAVREYKAYVSITKQLAALHGTVAACQGN